ncbi:MAG: regulatory protein RecX [Rhodothermia bacterium]
MGSEEVKRGIDVAVGFIAYRMRSEFEVRRRLKRARLDDEDVATVIARIKEMKLIDDRAFAGAYTRDQIIGRKRGPVRVKSGLTALGVSKEIAAVAIDEVVADHGTLAPAMELGEKRWGKLSRIRDQTSKKKRVYEYLVRRGYSFTDARHVVDELERTSGQS